MIKNQIVDFHLISFSTMEFQNKTLLQYITNVYLTHAKKSQVETESTVDLKTLVYTEKTFL